MSYHHCPIEPDDWTNGPSWLYDDGNCRECEGTGEIIDSQDNEQTCPACGGSGWINDNA